MYTYPDGQHTHTHIKIHNHINKDTQTQMTHIDQGISTETHRIPHRETQTLTEEFEGLWMGSTLK